MRQALQEPQRSGTPSRPDDLIPPAEIVRSRLGETLRQLTLLRRLLRLAEQAEEYQALTLEGERG